MEKKISPETTKKIQELQILEQSLQTVLLQKQAFQMELNETSLALEELKTAEKDSKNETKLKSRLIFQMSAEQNPAKRRHLNTAAKSAQAATLQNIQPERLTSQKCMLHTLDLTRIEKTHHFYTTTPC